MCAKYHACAEKNDSRVNMTTESKKNKTERGLPPFFLFDLSADPVCGHIGRPNRFKIAQWIPDHSNFEPQRP